MINRREFALLTATAGAASLALGAPTKAAKPRPILKPKRLSEGDLVGLVLPAFRAFEAEEIHLARETLEALGFRVKIGAHAFDQHAYLAGKDKDRAADLNTMFADREVAGIFCFTGGWGTPRVLPYLDYDLIRRNPKVLIGYSDITALLNTVHQQTGLITFHGPVASSTFTEYTLDNFRRVIMNAEPIGTLSNPSKKDNELTNRKHHITKVTGGRGTGRITGGNLTLVASLMGTRYEIDTDGALLFLEDITEELYRVDRMLTQLALGGKFDGLAGVVFGKCTNCPVDRITFSLEELIRERFGSLGIPVIAGFAFGHIEEKLTLPIGMRATLDADAGTVIINEPAVV